MKQRLIVPILVGLISLYTAGTLAEDEDRSQDRMQTQNQVQDRIYGSQLMAEKERNEYRGVGAKFYCGNSDATVKRLHKEM